MVLRLQEASPFKQPSSEAYVAGETNLQTLKAINHRPVGIGLDLQRLGGSVAYAL